MPRIRSIKPDFFKSEDVSTLPLRARLTWIGLWTQCDDHGRYKDSTRLIKGDVWSLDNVTLREIEEDLAALADQGRIVRYEVDGKRYLAIVNWHAHQAINRPGRPKHPAPPTPLGSSDPDDPNRCDICAKAGHGALREPSLSPHGAGAEPADVSAGQPDHAQLSEGSLSPHGAFTEGSRQEGKGKEGRGREGTARASGSRSEPTPAPQPQAPPSPKCDDHQNDPDPPPCGRCADARKSRERWDRDQAAARAAAQAQQAQARAAAARDAIAACHLCDHTGYLDDGRLCTHDPDQADRVTRGAAAARAALRRAPAGEADPQ